MQHQHSWVAFIENALGVFSKRDDCQTPDEFWAKGSVSTCMERECPALYFTPHNHELMPVECVLIDVRKSA